MVAAHKRAPFGVPAGRKVPSHINPVGLRFGHERTLRNTL